MQRVNYHHLQSIYKQRASYAGRLLKFIVPTYLTSLFTTVYTIIDGIFVSAYVGTNALASINIVYPIVNVLTGIALVFATGGSAVTALHIGGNYKKEAGNKYIPKALKGIPKRSNFLFTKNIKTIAATPKPIHPPLDIVINNEITWMINKRK